MSDTLIDTFIWSPKERLGLAVGSPLHTALARKALKLEIPRERVEMKSIVIHIY